MFMNFLTYQILEFKNWVTVVGYFLNRKEWIQAVPCGKLQVFKTN